MKMPEKNPDTWAAIVAWWGDNQPVIHAVGLSVAIAVVRVIYGAGRTRQMVLEGVLCGLATMTLIPLLEVLGLPLSMASFVGGMVGLIGVEKLRELALRFSDERVR